MSILIKGMTMPERCSWCKFIDYFEGNPEYGGKMQQVRSADYLAENAEREAAIRLVQGTGSRILQEAACRTSSSWPQTERSAPRRSAHTATPSRSCAT